MWSGCSPVKTSATRFWSGTAMAGTWAMPDGAGQRKIRFDGQVAVVTGAGRGLGAAYARLLAARGAAVVVHDAGVGLDGGGFDPEVANAVARDIAAAGGAAVACHENREDGAACRRVVASAVERF